MPRVMTIGRIGTLGKCSCQGPTSGLGRAPAKKRKRRSKGKGKFCVLTKRGKIFNCYKEQKTARKIAKRFGYKVR